MGNFTFPRWLTHAWMLVVLGMLVLVQPASVHAQTPTASTLFFLDERDLRVDFTRLAGQQGSLTVEIYNKAFDAQTVELRVIGLAPLTGNADPKLGWILPDVVRQRIDGSRVGVLALVFRTDIQPDSGAYEGYLVATGERGDAIRRKFILMVSPAGQSAPPGIRVEGRSSATLTAVNYIPSIFSPLLPTLLLLGFGLAALLTIARLAPGRVNIFLGLGVTIAVALALALVGEAATRAGVHGLQRVCATAQQSPAREVCRLLHFSLEPSLVVATPVSVAPIVGEGQGEMVALVGGGKLVVNNGLLTVQDVPRANRYEWPIDLLPNTAEQGSMVITALVADWWPWAALTIGLGLVLGQWITQYFQLWRGQHQQELRRVELETKIREDEDQFWTKHPELGVGDLKAVRITALARDWLAEVDLALKAQETAEAQASLNQLESFFGSFRVLRDDMVDLHGQRDDVWEKVVDWSPLDANAIEIFAAVNTEFGRVFRYVSPAVALKGLQGRMDRVDAYGDWLGALDRTLTLIAAYDAHADTIPEGTGHQQERLEDLRTELRHAAVMAITTNRRRVVDQQNDLADDIGHHIEELHREIDRDAAVERDGSRLRLPMDEPVLDESSAPRLLGFLGRSGEAAHTAPGTARRPSYQDLDLQFQQSELQMSVIAGVVAVGSGMLALYLNNPTWGTPADYLMALLWGSTISEGLKYVNVLIRRVWSA